MRSIRTLTRDGWFDSKNIMLIFFYIAANTHVLAAVPYINSQRICVSRAVCKDPPDDLTKLLSVVDGMF